MWRLAVVCHRENRRKQDRETELTLTAHTLYRHLAVTGSLSTCWGRSSRLILAHMAAVLLQHQRLQNSSYLMLKLIIFVSCPASHFQMLDLFSSPSQSKTVCSISHRIISETQTHTRLLRKLQSSSHTHTHTRSSLSHECAADRGLSPLTPKLVVAICAKVSPCFLFATTTNSGLVSVYLRSGSRLAPWRPDSRGRFARAVPWWQQDF